MKITENVIRDLIRSIIEEFDTGTMITLESASWLANWIYNNLGISVTTLYVEKIWKEIAAEMN